MELLREDAGRNVRAAGREPHYDPHRALRVVRLRTFRCQRNARPPPEKKGNTRIISALKALNMAFYSPRFKLCNKYQSPYGRRRLGRSVFGAITRTP